MPRIQAAQMVDVELCDRPATEREQIVGQHQPGSSEAPTPLHVGASVGSGVLNMSKYATEGSNPRETDPRQIS